MYCICLNNNNNNKKSHSIMNFFVSQGPLTLHPLLFMLILSYMFNVLFTNKSTSCRQHHIKQIIIIKEHALCIVITFIIIIVICFCYNTYTTCIQKIMNKQQKNI